MRSEPKNLAGTRNDVIKTTRTQPMSSIIHDFMISTLPAINSAQLSSEMLGVSDKFVFVLLMAFAPSIHYRCISRMARDSQIFVKAVK